MLLQNPTASSNNSNRLDSAWTGRSSSTPTRGTCKQRKDECASVQNRRTAPASHHPSKTSATPQESLWRPVLRHRCLDECCNARHAAQHTAGLDFFNDVQAQTVIDHVRAGPPLPPRRRKCRAPRTTVCGFARLRRRWFWLRCLPQNLGQGDGHRPPCNKEGQRQQDKRNLNRRSLTGVSRQSVVSLRARMASPERIWSPKRKLAATTCASEVPKELKAWAKFNLADADSSGPSTLMYGLAATCRMVMPPATTKRASKNKGYIRVAAAG